MNKHFVTDPPYRMSIYPFGERAIVLEYCDTHAYTQTEILRCQRHLIRLAELCRQSADVISAVLGNLNLTLRFDPLTSDADTLSIALIDNLKNTNSDLNTTHREHTAESTHILAVRYGDEYGPDLQYVADCHHMSCDDVIALHCSAEYHVLFNGFLPGFPYLTGLPEQLHTPRKAKPRISVQAGAVAIGGSQAGIYPCNSPGGWQIIGQLDTASPALFSLNRARPLLLPAGDRVRFMPVQ